MKIKYKRNGRGVVFTPSNYDEHNNKSGDDDDDDDEE